MASLIRWKRSDYIKLGRAIADFNKKIKQIETEENKLYLPDFQNYTEKKSEIKTRNELNRYINSIKRFKEKGAEEKYITKAGEEMTVWERRELGIQSGIAKRLINKEIENLGKPKKEYGGFSRREMGSQRLKELQRTLQSINIENIEFKKGYELNRLKQRINKRGSLDFNMTRAINYRENIVDELRQLSEINSDFKVIYEFLNNIKNPEEFYKISQKSRAMQDFFEWYKNPESYGDFKTTDELADYIMNEYNENN